MRPMFLEDVVATIDFLSIINSIKIIPQGEYAYCIRENSTLTSKWTLKKSIDELESIIHVYNFISTNAPDSEQMSITYFWIVSMLTNIRKLYGINYLEQHSGRLHTPPTQAPVLYDKLRLHLIKILGLQRYISFATSLGNSIGALKK